MHDMGGMHGFGPVVPEADEPVFHFDWERRVFGLNFADLPGSSDVFRQHIERMDPIEYLTASYYERWLHAAASMAAGAEARPVDPARAQWLVAALQKPPPPPPPGDGRYGADDTVRVRRFHVDGHTRCPRYLRGAWGTVRRVHGRFGLPDAKAAGDAGVVETVYNVEFDAVDLWGEGAAGKVYADLWESYLE